MITNTTSVTPSLDPYQLRNVADCLRDKTSLQSLAQQWEFEGERDLLIETARSLGLEYLETDDVQVDPTAMEGFPIKLIHRHEVFHWSEPNNTCDWRSAIHSTSMHSIP